MKLISKRGLFALPVVLMALWACTACKKCHTCIAKDQDGVVRYTYPEVCGSKEELRNYANQCEADYGQYDYTCQCGEDL